MKRRTMTILVVKGTDPDEFESQGLDQRRHDGMGWSDFELLHPGEPDLVVRKALDLDLGIYGAENRWHGEERCVVHTCLITSGDVKDAAKVLKQHLSKPAAVAARFIEHTSSSEDAARVARALSTEPKVAGGPAEEASSWMRGFLEHVPTALQWKMGIAWEIRRPASCECAADEGTTPASRHFPPLGLRVTSTGQGTDEHGTRATIGRLMCNQCRAAFTYVSTSNYTTITRAAKQASAKERAGPKKRATRKPALEKKATKKQTARVK